MVSTMTRVVERAITVLLVEDHRLVADGLAAALRDDDEIASITVAASIADAEAAITSTPMDVVLMDFRLGDGDGVEGARRMLAAAPQTHVVMLTAAPAEAVLDAALEAGCTGFVGKDSSIDELVAAVRAAANGDSYFSPGALSALVSRHRGVTPNQLTGREREVLLLVADGHSVGAIAERLFLSVHTVRNHLRHIQSKLGAHSKLEAVLMAARQGLISLEPPPGGRR